jgi:hypothetical protein
MHCHVFICSIIPKSLLSSFGGMMAYAPKDRASTDEWLDAFQFPQR